MERWRCNSLSATTGHWGRCVTRALFQQPADCERVAAREAFTRQRSGVGHDIVVLSFQPAGTIEQQGSLASPSIARLECSTQARWHRHNGTGTGSMARAQCHRLNGSGSGALAQARWHRHDGLGTGTIARARWHKDMNNYTGTMAQARWRSHRHENNCTGTMAY